MMKRFLDWLLAPRPLLDAFCAGMFFSFALAFGIAGMWWRCAWMVGLFGISVYNAHLAAKLKRGRVYGRIILDKPGGLVENVDVEGEISIEAPNCWVIGGNIRGVGRV